MKPNETTNSGQTGKAGHLRWTTAILLLFLLTVAGTVRAQVTNIIYQDRFARVGVLNGSAPDTVNAYHATWLSLAGPTNIITDGSEAAITNVFNGPPYPDSFLPLIIETGHVYTVTASIFVNTNYGANWMWLGDAIAPGFNVDANNGSVGVAWMLQRSTNGPPSSGFEAFAGPGTASFSPNITNSVAGFVTNSIVLNTATNPTQWNVSWYTNGVYATNYTFTSIPTANNGTRIQFVGFGASGADGYVQNFSVVDVVPVPSAPVILEQPNNLTGQVGQTVTFWVAAMGLPDPTYQWMTNSPGGPTNAIVGATNATYTTPPLSSSYNGLKYSVTAFTAAGSTNSAPATLTVVAGQPTVFSATKTIGLTNVVVMFSGPVSPATALNTANYSVNINGAPSGISVLSASYGSSSNNVILTTSTLNTNAGYYLTVQNVQDSFGDIITSGNNVPILPVGLVFYVRGDSGVRLDGSGNVVEWLDQTTNGNNAVQFFGMSAYTSGLTVAGPGARPNTNTTIGPNDEPALTFNSSSDNFLTAAFSPSLTINNNMSIYVFANAVTASPTKDFINESMGNQPGSFDYQLTTGGDQSFLRGYGTGNASVTATGSYAAGTPHVYAVTSLNTGTNSSGAVTNLIENYIDGVNNNSTTSNAIVANPGDVDCEQPLYIGWRSDHYASAIMNGQVGEIMLFNTALSGPDRTNLDNYFGQKYFPFAISQNLPATLTTSNGFSVTYTFGASIGSTHGLSIQWQENGTNIPGATSLSFTTPILGPSNNGNQFDVLVTFPNGSTTNSTTNTLTVLPTAPYVTAAGIPIWAAANPTNVVVLFDVAVDPVTGTASTNYTLNNGASVVSAAIGDAPNKVVLTTTSVSPWNANPGNYSLTVKNVQDQYGDTIVTASTPVGLYPINVALWVQANTGVTASGGSVTTWNDLSGNQNTLNTISGIAPLLGTTYHGNPYILFNGTNDTEMDAFPPIPALAITNDMSVIAAVNFSQPLSTGTNADICSKVSANIPAPYDYYVGTTAGLLRGNGSTYGSFSATNSPLVGWWQILGVSETGNTVTHYLNGNFGGSGLLSSSFQETNSADAGNDFSIGVRGDQHNRLTGGMAELMVFGSGVDSNDMAAIQNYLASKYVIPLGSNAYPAITQQPVASTNIDQNSALIIPAAASGTSIAYQWFDVNNIGQVGQTNATLSLGDMQTSDGYYLVVTNVYGALTSSVVNVTLYSGLTAALGPPSQTLYAGQPYTLNVQAFGTAPLYYQWYQGDSLIPNATNASYTTLVAPGSTSYTCTVTNSYNGLTSTNTGPVTLIGVAAPSNLYQTAVLANQPVAYWRLNEVPNNGSGNNGTIAYDYVGGHNAVYSNVVLGVSGFSTLSSTDSAALFGTLTLSNSYAAEINQSAIGLMPINFAQPATYNAEFSIEAWVVSSNSSQISGAGIVTKGFGDGGEQFDLDDYSGDFRFFVRDASGTTHGPTSSVAPVVGQWYHVVAVWDGANGVAHLYINGVDTIDSTGTAPGVGLLATATTNTAFTAANQVSIGCRTSGETVTNFDLQFEGNIQDVALYDYVLSPAQVLADYVAGIKDAVFTTTPTNITMSSVSNQLTLSWPLTHYGWQLQVQTNNLAVGISTNWVNVSGTIGTNQVVIPINLTNGSVFYRLVYP